MEPGDLQDRVAFPQDQDLSSLQTTLLGASLIPTEAGARTEEPMVEPGEWRTSLVLVETCGPARRAGMREVLQGRGCQA